MNTKEFIIYGVKVVFMIFIISIAVVAVGDILEKI